MNEHTHRTILVETNCTIGTMYFLLFFPPPFSMFTCHFLYELYPGYFSLFVHETGFFFVGKVQGCTINSWGWGMEKLFRGAWGIRYFIPFWPVYLRVEKLLYLPGPLFYLSGPLFYLPGPAFIPELDEGIKAGPGV